MLLYYHDFQSTILFLWDPNWLEPLSLPNSGQCSVELPHPTKQPMYLLSFFVMFFSTDKFALSLFKSFSPNSTSFSRFFIIYSHFSKIPMPVSIRNVIRVLLISTRFPTWIKPVGFKLIKYLWKRGGSMSKYDELDKWVWFRTSYVD